MALDGGDKKRHLKKLPPKSFEVAEGDVIGGLIYVRDKPLGIEEGMVGISIDSQAYRQYLKDFILTLDQNKNQQNPSPIQTKYNQLVKYSSFDELTPTQQNLVIDIFLHHPNLKPFLDSLDSSQNNEAAELIKLDLEQPLHKTIPVPFKDNFKKIFTKKMHEISTTQYENEGMGGLLFAEYKNHCDIKSGEHFAKQIQKLIQGGSHDPNAPKNAVYMIKQDGKLGLFGGTGPGPQKILKTTTGKALQKYATPKWLIPTLGLSGLYLGAVLGIRRLGYLLTNKPTKVNSDAMIETIATKLARAKGCQTQNIEILNGTYENDSPKFVTMVTWTPGCLDFSDKLKGKKAQGVLVAHSLEGEVLKIDKEGNILIKKEIGIEHQYFKIDKNKNQQIITKDQKNEFNTIKQAYDEAFYVSENKIDGLGESLITFISLGDRDGIGKKGQNKAYIPGKSGKMQFFGIDFGKAYQGPNPIIGSLKDDFSFENPKSSPPKSWFVDERFHNYSMLYDNPLREKMKGIYLLAALRGKLLEPLKTQIADEYKSTDPDFAQKLSNYPGSPGIDFDLEIIEEQINHFQNKKQENPKKAKEFENYITKLEEIKELAKNTDDKILEIFSNRMQLLPSQIDVLDSIEKLTARKAHRLTSDGKVILNHIRIDNADRISWQFDKDNLVCGPLDQAELGPLIQKIDSMKNSLANQITRLKTQDKLAQAKDLEKLLDVFNKVKFTSMTQIKIPFDTELIKTFNTYVTEELAAKVQQLPTFQKNVLKDFDRNRAKMDNFTKPKKPELSQKKPPEDLANENLVSEDLGNEDLVNEDDLFQQRKGLRFVAPSHTQPSPKIEVIATAQTTLEQLSNYLKKEKDNSPIWQRHHLKKVKSIQLGAFEKPNTLEMTFNNQKQNTTVKVFAKAVSDTNVQYATTNSLSEEQFKLAATEACRLAVFSATQKTQMTISTELSPEKQQFLREAFSNAIQEAISANIFTHENKPIVSDQKVQIKPSL
ncbi:MAG: hypothetical protein JSS07_04665 [Proteobacteria bacterium]|nr:hypothetical protein [Pseudomonadota bacterium]